MKKELLIISLVVAFAAVSCKKDTVEAIPDVIPKTTGDIIVPTGFTWESSRNVNFSVSITNAQFQDIIHVISIYDGDPVSGGKLMIKGSATTIAPFKSKLYLSNQLTEVYIVCTAPDNVRVTQKVKAVTANVNVLLAL